MTGTIKAYRIKPLHKTEEIQVENTLRALQEVVGGYIEAVSLVGGKINTIILCDEEGKLKRKLPTVYIRGELFVGTVLFVGADRKGEFCDCPLTKEQLEAILYEGGQE